MPGLDVLRGIAISMVLVFHGLGPNGSPGPSPDDHIAFHLWKFAELGEYGVHLFFILSGFLITGILLKSRDDADYYRNFYLRRVLRIVPAYLLMLAILLSGRFISWRYLVVCLLYLCNMPGLLGASPEYGPLWSLSVEEQFYLVWPFVVRRLSLRNLAIFSICLVLITPALRFGLLYLPGSLGDIRSKTWALVDFFASGSAIAIAARSARFRPLLRKAGLLLLAGGSILIGIFLVVPRPVNPTGTRLWLACLLEPWLLVFSGMVVMAFLYPAIARLTVFKPMVFLANISYGLYLCHQLIFDMVNRHWPFNPLSVHGPLLQKLLQFLAGVALSIAIAYVSRNTMEQFFLKLKPKHHHSVLNAA
jgi:peptidoglycan/LPS O-acetylase OafA/YrhL